MPVFTRAREALYLGFRIDRVNNIQQQDSRGDADKLRNECHGGHYFAESLHRFPDQYHNRDGPPD